MLRKKVKKQKHLHYSGDADIGVLQFSSLASHDDDIGKNGGTGQVIFDLPELSGKGLVLIRKGEKNVDETEKKMLARRTKKS